MLDKDRTRADSRPRLVACLTVAAMLCSTVQAQSTRRVEQASQLQSAQQDSRLTPAQQATQVRPAQPMLQVSSTGEQRLRSLARVLETRSASVWTQKPAALPDAAATTPSDSAVPEPEVVVPPIATAEAPGLQAVRLSSAERVDIQSHVARVLGAQQPSSISVFPDVIRSVDGEHPPVMAALFVQTSGPLTYKPEKARFESTLMVGALPLPGSASRHLAEPIHFQVLESGVAEPEVAIIDKSGVPYRRVVIATSSVEGPFTVHVATDEHPRGVPAAFQVSPTLFVQPERKSIQGLGLEQTRLIVTSIGFANPGGRKVALEVDDSAHLDAGQLTLDESGSAVATLRSDGVGTATVTAKIPGVTAAHALVVFAFPWMTIASTLLGGVIGGAIRLGSKSGRSRRWPKTVAALLVSMLVGVLVFGMTVLGANVLPVEFSVRVGQVFAFVVSALGAYIGTSLLTRGD